MQKNSNGRQAVQTNPVFMLLKWYGERYRYYNGKTYLAKHKKDMSLLKKLLDVTTVEDVQLRAEDFFNDTDPFNVRAGWTIGVFYARFNQYPKGQNGTEAIKRRANSYREIGQEELVRTVEFATRFGKRS